VSRGQQLRMLMLFTIGPETFQILRYAFKREANFRNVNAPCIRQIEPFSRMVPENGFSLKKSTLSQQKAPRSFPTTALHGVPCLCCKHIGALRNHVASAFLV
jgi:hypothetical protein